MEYDSFLAQGLTSTPPPPLAHQILAETNPWPKPIHADFAEKRPSRSRRIRRGAEVPSTEKIHPENIALVHIKNIRQCPGQRRDWHATWLDFTLTKEAKSIARTRPRSPRIRGNYSNSKAHSCQRSPPTFAVRTVTPRDAEVFVMRTKPEEHNRHSPALSQSTTKSRRRMLSRRIRRRRRHNFIPRRSHRAKRLRPPHPPETRNVGRKVRAVVSVPKDKDFRPGIHPQFRIHKRQMIKVPATAEARLDDLTRGQFNVRLGVEYAGRRPADFSSGTSPVANGLRYRRHRDGEWIHDFEITPDSPAIKNLGTPTPKQVREEREKVATPGLAFTPVGAAH